MRALLAAALLLASCGPLAPLPVLPPPDGPGTCATACARLEALGGCGLASETCPADCADASAAEADVGVRFPVGCLSAAASCEEAWACR